MGNTLSYDPAHVRIYQNLLKIQSPVTRANMIDTLFSTPEYVAVAKQAGLYAELVKYTYAVRNGHISGGLPGESGAAATGSGAAASGMAGRAEGAAAASSQHPKGFLGTITHYADKINPWKQVSKKPQEKVLSYFNACLDVLGLDEKQELTEDILRAAYKKASVKAHPDKGGSEEAFQTVARAYAYLSEILKRIRGEGTQREGPPLQLEVRGGGGPVAIAGQVQMSSSAAAAAPQDPAAAIEERLKHLAPIKLNPKSLNMETFNRMFEQTRLADPEAEGYDGWLKGDDAAGAPEQPTFSGKFNADNFNRAFSAHTGRGRGEESHRDIHPASMALTMAPDMGVELASEGRSDFTAPANADLQYTDLKRAYTTDSTFTNKVADVVVEHRDMKRYQAEREKAPVLSAYERQQIDAEEERVRRADAARTARLDQQRRQEELYFERMKGLIITDNGR